jgi:hypothetical protein
MSKSKKKKPQTISKNNRKRRIDKHYKHRMMRKHMELIIQLISALSGIGFLTLAILAFTHKQATSTIIWVAYFTLITIVLVPFLYWQKRVWEQSEAAAAAQREEPETPQPVPNREPPQPPPKPESLLRGFLIPANDPTPPNPCGEIPPNAVLLLFGNSAAYTTSTAAGIIKLISGEDILSFERTSDGLYVNATVRNSDNRQVAKITRNVLRVEANDNYYRERPDQHSVVVLDPNDRIVLYVRYLNPSAIKILGIFHNPGHQSVIIEDDEQMIGTGKYSQMCFGAIPKGGAAFLIN